MNWQTGIVYGPVNSRRLGRSLGVNLTPAGHRACSFACVYCDGPPEDPPGRTEWPRPIDVLAIVDRALAASRGIESITVAGNGEPTLHPAFALIADDLFHLRARRAPQAKLTLLSNGSTLNRLDVVSSLGRFDVRSIKLDAGDATTFRLVNRPSVPLGRLIADLRSVGRLTLQSMFVRDAQGLVDNTVPRAVDAWLEAVDRIQPAGVDIQTLQRPPVQPSLVKVPAHVLEEIAVRVKALGVPARVFA
jgi:wyosine [tRNA(Phe)-imidazoG37] synthetase (radical SAM superfamily)